MFSKKNHVKKYLQGEGLKLAQQILPNLVTVFKYCPVTSVDAGRSFSTYKLILTDKCHTCIAKGHKKM
jgi:hypothetical protein